MSKIIFISQCLIFILFHYTSASIEAGTKSKRMNQDISKKYQEKLDSTLIKYNLIGLQTSIRTTNNLKWNGAAGYIDKKGKNNMTTDHILRIGSITKTFVAVVLMNLAREDKIDLDDSIDRWFPEIYNSEKITLRMLLNQTSGIENYWKSSSALMKTLLGKKWKPEELIKIIAKQKPHSEPGCAFYYSNSNYVILSSLIEKITQKPISDAIQNYVFSKCAMKNTYFLPQSFIPEKLITGYDNVYIPWIGSYKLKPKNKTWPFFAYGAGAMASNTSDLILFIDSLFFGSIVSESILTDMQTFNPAIQTTNEAIPGQVSYGLGLARFEIGEDVLWGHMGGLMGFESVVLHCKEKNYSIAVIGNLSICNVIEIVEDFQDVL